jgi:hypothetical protein
VADPRGTHPRILELVVLVSVGTVLLFVGSMFLSTDGHFVPQVVDLYLVCQYARAFAEGHAFHYNVGDPASTGATSLLYTATLSLAHAAGARGEGLVAVAILAGALLYLGSVVMAYRVATLLASQRVALLAAALLSLGGPAVWGFLYGSDIGLFMFLSLWLFERFLLGWRRGSPTGWILPGCLLSLARPEGLPIGLALGLSWSVHFGGARPGFKKLLPWLPAATALGVLLFYRVLTGQWLGTSVSDKSLFANYGLRDGIGMVVEYLMGIIRGLLLGFYPPETMLGFSKGWAPFYFPPLALLLIMVSLMSPREAQAPLRVWLAVILVLFVLTTPSMFMGVHFNRYLMWAFPTLFILVAVGWGDLVASISRGNDTLDAVLFRAGATLMIACGVLSTIRFAALYGELAGEVNRRDLSAAQWISNAMNDGRLPKHAAMADVATSVEFLTGHRNINLHGVNTPAFFGGRAAEREAGVFEALGRLELPERPDFLITSLAAQESYPSLKALVAEPPLFMTTSGADEIVIYRMNYDLMGRNGSFLLPETLKAVEGLREVDRINICDSRDESRHGYRYRSYLGDLLLNGTVRQESYHLSSGSEPVIDAGRAILGEESFHVRTLPGRELVVILRTAATANAHVFRAAGPLSLALAFPEAGFLVSVNGRPRDTVRFRPREGWEELCIRIPGPYIEGSDTFLRFSGRYASFYYWFYQS